MAIQHKRSQIGSMTGQEIFDRLKPFLQDETKIEDLSGLVVVATHTDGSVEVSGPHSLMHRGMILAQALEYIGHAITQEDVIDFLAEDVEAPDDASEIDGL